jgi:hypothetical protein
MLLEQERKDGCKRSQRLVITKLRIGFTTDDTPEIKAKGWSEWHFKDGGFDVAQRSISNNTTEITASLPIFPWKNLSLSKTATSSTAYPVKRPTSECSSHGVRCRHGRDRGRNQYVLLSLFTPVLKNCFSIRIWTPLTTHFCSLGHTGA